ncbi:TolC family protein [Sulfurirhabdus autotrophica]|uniref:Cobalt-zinc-cadmium efflux system outer membrane protein n=1 Tax=Sulfurirhabdus autotrophica TaxID=1706046 RepID=A0A4R3XSI3_9PROT|nr:TolC family protein [Sulfurirhabdus autotrophica]TCV78295.1 cobalt-zinc-cadmium efflux system outer membrane protein [Sulfurirhabdus autotrophica]
MKLIILSRTLLRLTLARKILVIPYACAVLYAAPAISAQLTLDQAWRQAEEANPTLHSAKANLAMAQGELTDARALLWNNPQLTAERRRREIPQSADPTQINREWSVGLAQTFEIAGQQGARRNAAEQSFAATQEVISETRRQLRAEVEQRFVRVLSLQLRIQTEEQTLKLIQQAATMVGKRVAAGEDGRLDGNLAKVEAERAQNQVSMFREQLIQARTELATLLQLPAGDMLEVAGALDPGPAPYTIEELLLATSNRPALRALDFREKAAKSRLDLERSSVYPDVTVGLTAAREGPADTREKVAGISISLPLPLFRRNDTAIGRATTELTQAQIEIQAAKRDTRAQVFALWERLENLKSRVHRLTESVLPSLEESQHLSSMAFQAGEIGLMQLLLVNRQVLDGQRDLLDARTEQRLAKITLEATAGWQSPDDTR